MKKEKNNLNLAEEQPKKGFFSKIFNGKAEQSKILKLMASKKAKDFLFYTDVDNALIILENGIKSIKDKSLKKGEEYSVWTYLENENSVGLEFDSSTRANFWKWATNAKVDVSKVAVFGIDSKKLSTVCKKDWSFDDTTNITYVYETIPTTTISWIMIKDKKNLQRIKTAVESNSMDIKVFFGEEGNIEE